MKKIKKISEYTIAIEEDGSVSVSRNYDNVKAALREIATHVGFSYDNNWNTRQFGKKNYRIY